jgi:lipopolysaccharide/colanic/teichoic acid biosynthesis glycosyltransferase
LRESGEDLAWKRRLDVLIAALGLALAAIPMVGIATAIVVKTGFPVFLRQPRPGYRGRMFTLYKFRTMREARDAAGNLLPDEDRLTPVGRWLRRTSLDELPELVNVLQGDMSLVGPRPLLPQYLGRYSAEQARRHEVPPGITGWAQVNGRNAITWEDKFAFDVWYVDHHSLALDVRILWMTLMQVLNGNGISAEGHATMPEFMGSEED